MLRIVFLLCCVLVTVVVARRGPEPTQSVYPGICPQIMCPNDLEIPHFCGKPEFVIGTDGQSRCRVCDSNLCGPRHMVCPQIQCPDHNDIPHNCRVEQNIIGTDGITLCTMCSKDGCRA